MLRCALAGLQGHASRALKALPRTDDAQIVAYAPIPPEESAQAFGVWNSTLTTATGYDSWQKMIDEEKPDLVQVSGAHYQNATVAAYAAERGCHVLVEKPIATTLDDLARLKAAVDRGGVELTAMLGMRLEPPYVAAMKAIAEGRIGEPLLVTAQKSYKFGNNRPEWYGSREKFGGSIPWVAIHMIDMINHFLGDPFASVTARHAAFESGKQRPGCEDVMAIAFTLKNGGAAMVNGDYLRPPGAENHGDDRIRVAGTRGVVEVLFGKTTLIDAEGSRELPLDREADDVSLNFVRHLVHGEPHILGPNDAFRSTEVALLARESADRLGETIDLTQTPYPCRPEA
jgi:predicted dehydrogenase